MRGSGLLMVVGVVVVGAGLVLLDGKSAGEVNEEKEESLRKFYEEEWGEVSREEEEKEGEEEAVEEAFWEKERDGIGAQEVMERLREEGVEDGKNRIEDGIMYGEGVPVDRLLEEVGE